MAMASTITPADFDPSNPSTQANEKSHCSTGPSPPRVPAPAPLFLTLGGIASPDFATTHRFTVLCARHIDPRTSAKLGRARPLDPPTGGGVIAYTGTQHPSSSHSNALRAAGSHWTNVSVTDGRGRRLGGG